MAVDRIDAEPFKLKQVVAIIETFAPPEDLEEWHHVALLASVRAQLLEMVAECKLEIVRFGRRGLSFIYQLRRY